MSHKLIHRPQGLHYFSSWLPGMLCGAVQKLLILYIYWLSLANSPASIPLFQRSEECQMISQAVLFPTQNNALQTWSKCTLQAQFCYLCLSTGAKEASHFSEISHHSLHWANSCFQAEPFLFFKLEMVAAFKQLLLVLLTHYISSGWQKTDGLSESWQI